MSYASVVVVVIHDASDTFAFFLNLCIVTVRENANIMWIHCVGVHNQLSFFFIMFQLLALISVLLQRGTYHHSVLSLCLK